MPKDNPDRQPIANQFLELSDEIMLLTRTFEIYVTFVKKRMHAAQ